MAKDDGGSKVWSVFSLLASILAATVARKVMTLTWKAATGKNPPTESADTDVRLSEAVSWAAASGVAVGVAKLLATRRAADYYTRSTGHKPPTAATETKPDTDAKV